MRKHVQLLYFIFLIYFTTNTELIPQTLQYPPDIEERIKQFEGSLSSTLQSKVKWTLDERMSYYKIPGLSIAVVNDYRIEWAKGYGLADTSENSPVTTETLFQAGSVSKSLNAVGVLKLVQDSTIGLHSDINNYLTSWQFPYDMFSKDKKITIAHLLSHTAGLSVHGFLGYKRTDSLPTIIQILDGTPPANTFAVRSTSEPGLKYQYSGGGTIISQLIVMDNSKKPYDEYMKQNVLNPIGMTNSFYAQPPPETYKSLLATGYNETGELEGKYYIHPEQAAAGLWTNPTDLCKYIIETQLSYQGKSNKVLSEEATKLRLTPFFDKSYAFGVFISDNGVAKYFYHSGKNQGFLTYYIASIEDGKGVAFMYNNSINATIMTEIFNSIANVYKWKGFYKPTDVTENPNEGMNRIFPNPAMDFINIISEETDAQIFIFDLFGRKVMESPFQARIDIRDLNAGVYFLTINEKIYRFFKI
jgi:CubicO group peptidase (beta-lactamase class C family)